MFETSTNQFAIYAELGSGFIKFRFNEDWGNNYGDDGEDGSLEPGGANIAVTEGTYLITMDLDNLTYSVTEVTPSVDQRGMFHKDGQNLEIESLSSFLDGYAVAKFKNVDSNGMPGSDSTGTFTDTDLPLIRLAEIYFNYAEAALRGWAGAGTAQENYEAGVNLSFEDWGAGGAAAYLADDTSLPIDYEDPNATGAVNDFVNRITRTIAWDDADDNETKLEKIITQKWINGYTNSIEAWVDHRRTDYPKLPFNYKNDSNADWGVIPADDFLRRQVFLNSQRENNAASVAEATGFLGGPDEIGTRLWWDTGGPNF